MPQLTYPLTRDVAFAGMRSGTPYGSTKSASAEEAMGFGLFVKRGTDPQNQVLLPTAAAQPYGITAHTHASDRLGTASPAAGDQMNILTKGTVWCVVGTNSSTAIVAGLPVHVVFQVASGDAKGEVSEVDDADTFLVSGAVFTGAQETTTDSVVIAEVEINFPA